MQAHTGGPAPSVHRWPSAYGCGSCPLPRLSTGREMLVDAVDVLSDLQAAFFAALGVGALWQWRKLRSRPSAFLAAAFGVIAVVLVLGRVTARTGTVEVVTITTVALLAVFPWLLAAFAWSFEGPLPRWLHAAGAAIVGLILWGVLGSPLPPAGTEGTAHPAFVGAFVLVWTGLSAMAAVRLVTAGRRFPLVRDRMRLLAAGMVVMNAALLVAAFSPGQRTVGLQLATTALVLTSAALFLAGFAPPLMLRLWWRRSSTLEFQRLQAELITAVTPAQVAEAAAPRLSTMLGSGVALVGSDGTVMASAGLVREEAYELARQVVSDEPTDALTEATPVDRAWLVIRNNDYTPVFGQDERDLVSAFALHVRLAFERAQLFEAAEQARQDLETMLLSLAHDLRSPAVVIEGFATMLQDADDPGERAKMVDNIRSSASYLSQLIDALLELSRVGRAQTETAPVRLEQVAGQVVSRLGAAHPETSIEVRGAAPPVLINPVRAEQLVENLVGNAIKHGGRPDLAVAVEVSELPGGDVQLVVHDDGDGIPEPDRDRIFALFQRGRNAAGRGNGLGLGLVRRIAEATGGSLTLEPSDTGARFAVRFPAEVVQPSDASVAQPH